MEFLDCYTRVSTQEQKKDGNSLVVQREIGKKVAKKLGLKFRHRDEGARSSTIHYRDVLEELKDDIESGKVKHIWQIDLDRLFRDMTDALLFRRDYLERFDVKLYQGEFGNEIKFDDENAMLMYDILSRFAQHENRIRSARSQRGKIQKLKEAQKSNKSVYLGGTTLFGYQTENKEWKLNNDEVKWVKFIFDSYESGKSLVDIKKELDKSDVQPRRSQSGLWVLATLHKMLKNKTYTGIHTVKVKKLNNKEFSFKVPKIITISQFNRVQKMLDFNQKNKDNNKKHFALLDGLLVCECGSSFGSIAREFTRGNGVVVSTKKYFCRSNEYHWKDGTENECINTKAIYMDETDKLVMNLVKETVRNSNILKEQTKKEVLKKKNLLEENIVDARQKLEDKGQRIQKQIDLIENQIVDLEMEKVLGKRSESVVAKILGRYEEELERQNLEYRNVETELDKLHEDLVWVDWVEKFSDDLEMNMKSLDKKRDFLKGLLSKIVVHSVHGENRDGKQIQIGHKLELKFKLKIVGDDLIWNDLKDKRKGYKIREGKSHLMKDDVDSITMKLGRKGAKKKA